MPTRIFGINGVLLSSTCCLVSIMGHKNGLIEQNTNKAFLNYDWIQRF